MPSIEELAAHIDQPGIDRDPARDIVRLKPDIGYDEALAVQLAAKRRRVAAGDRIVGHQASFTSPGMRALYPDSPKPMVGTLLASLTRESGETVELDADKAYVESEIGVILKRDLEGPALTPLEVLSAIDAFLPAIEIAQLRPGVREGHFSWPHRIAIQKAAGGYFILGSKLTSARNFDPRLEGCLVSMDGEAKAGATGFEAMGNPLVVISAMARGLHAIGEKLRAGQFIATGSLPAPQLITPEHRLAQLEFQTLGNVSVRFRHKEETA